ncbi:MAG: hydrolase [Firmicutes bacterium]|nr:hydrolase [Bacillota bacterium]
MKTIKIHKEDAILVLIDFQERLMPAMENNEELVATVIKLIKGCNIMEIPKLVTQQYTKGLGPTIPGIHEALGKYRPIEKTSFSAMGEPAFAEALEKTGRKTVVLAGVESHVCVQQTALDLLEKGYHVFLAADCVSSRQNSDKKYALKRMAQAGAFLTTCEAVLFELCGDSRRPGFKEISALVK